MTLELEDLVRQAQQRQAERAVDPDRVRLALPARAARRVKRRRNGTLVAIAAAAAVTAAVAVPAVALRSNDPVNVQPGGPAVGMAPPTQPPPPALSAPLSFKPTWLPAGLRERSRVVPLADMGPGHIDGALRVYTTAAPDSTGEVHGPQVTVQVRKAAGVNDPEANEGTATTVNGKPGFYHAGVKGDAKSYVEWRADADWVVSVGQNGAVLSKTDLFRVAESVQPDPGSLDIPLRFGWLPDGVNPQFATFGGGSPTSWLLRVSGEQANTGTKETDKQNRGLEVELGTATYAPEGGKTVPVGRRTGRLVTRPEPATTFLVVDLGGGRLLTVIGQGGVSEQDVVRVAENTDVTGDPDLTWLSS